VDAHLPCGVAGDDDLRSRADERLDPHTDAPAPREPDEEPRFRDLHEGAGANRNDPPGRRQHEDREERRGDECHWLKLVPPSRRCDRPDERGTGSDREG
jgi:hypothetical protein